MSIGYCWNIVWLFHEVLGPQEHSDEMSEPVGPLVHDAGVSVHVDLDLVALPQLHHNALANHAVLVVGVVILVIETGNLRKIVSNCHIAMILCCEPHFHCIAVREVLSSCHVCKHGW